MVHLCKCSETALGQNPLVFFMTWEGYNHEDAVIMSERLVKDDKFTLLSTLKNMNQSPAYKLGLPKKLHAKFQTCPEDALKYLDKDGIICNGAEVKDGDICW